MRLWIVRADTKQQLEYNVKRYKNLYLVNGCILIALGILAIMVPVVAAEFLDLLIGAILLFTAISQFTISYMAKRHWTYYFNAIICLIAGSLMLIKPYEGVVALAVIIGIFLLIQGCIQLFTIALYAPFSGWPWILLSGIVSILLAGFMYSGWPITGVWLLGAMLGVNFIALGLSMIMLTRYA